MNFLIQLLQDLLPEKTRIFLTIFAVAIGTAAIMVMLSVGSGLRESLGNSMASGGSGILTIKPGTAELPYGGYPRGRSLSFTIKDIRAVQQELSSLAQVAGEYTTEALLKTDNASSLQAVSGVNLTYGKLRNLTADVGGRFFNQHDREQRRRVILLGDQAVERLFPDNPNPVGELLLVQGSPFTVIGVLPQRLRIGGASSRSDNHGAWIPDTTFNTIFSPSNVANIVIHPYLSQDMPLVKERVQQLFARLKGADPQDESILQIFDAQVVQQQTDTFLFGMVVFLGTIGSLTLAVAGVGIANVMYLTVKNATREIGLRMALGARKINILLHYLVQALLTTIAGGMLGILLGFGLVQLSGWALHHYTTTNRFMGEIEPLISVPIMATVVMILMIVGLCAGIFPARQAASITPAEALRDE
ncbi:MAG: ABC transporter permease [Gammaproteobacteria bacterium]